MAKFKVGDRVIIRPGVDSSRAKPGSNTAVRMVDHTGKRYILNDGSNVYEDEIRKQ